MIQPPMPSPPGGRPLSPTAAKLRLVENKATLPHVTPEARRYALRELARRAGVSRDFFEQWSLEAASEHTTVSLGSSSGKKIHFHHSAGDSLSKIAGGPIPVARAGWLDHPPGALAGTDLVLPFCESEADSRAPLYQPSGDGNLNCRLDLLSSLLLTLSRVEETLGDTRDEHGRFPASASVAHRHEFLERPILDEHGLAFAQALSFLLPSWRPSPPPLRFKLTHDMDDIGIPFELGASLGHSLKRGRPAATLRSVLSPLTAVDPPELAMIRSLAAISNSRGLHSAFYWKASPAGPYDSGYDPAHGKVQRVVEFLQKCGFELGIHPGYETFGNWPRLASEVEHLRRALRLHSPGGRQHYLRWSPGTWLDWEACGLSYDSSLGFADRFGFRAGTAFPYRPWSWRDNRELNLIEVPLILMDCTPVKYMKLSRPEGLARIQTLIRRTERTGGVFTLLWHNTPLLDPDYDGWYERILDLVADVPPFHVPANAEELW